MTIKKKQADDYTNQPFQVYLTTLIPKTETSRPI